METIPGGYNGGGTGSGSANLVYSSSGGGATHIGKVSGLLNTLSNNISDIIIVAGGGGGTSFQTGPYSGNGGSGGGYTGNNGTNTQSDYVYGSGGSQTAGGSSGGGSKVNNEDRGLKVVLVKEETDNTIQVEVEVASTEVEPLTKQELVEEVGTLETLYLVIK